MKTVYKAAGIIFAGCVVFFFILKIAGLQNADAAKLALTPFSAIGLVNSKIEDQAKLRNNEGKLRTFGDFSLPFWKAIALASISAIALTQLSSALVGMMVAAASASSGSSRSLAELVRVMEYATIPMNIYVLFAIGRWLGIKTGTGGLLASALVAALVRIADTGISLLVMAGADFKTIFGVETNDLTGIAGQVVTGILVLGGSCLLGFWRGKRRRQAWYLDHLLKSIAPESRIVIIGLAYDEALKTLASQGEFAGASKRSSRWFWRAGASA